MLLADGQTKAGKGGNYSKQGLQMDVNALVEVCPI